RSGRRMMRVMWRRGMLVGCGLLLAGMAGGCDAWLHATASLGGTTAGQRGNTEVVFINNTPYRAIFTFGTYDEFDRQTVPTLRQFSSATSTLNLEGNTQSDTLQVRCARVYAIGTEGLITRVHANLAPANYDNDALVQGVRFSSAAVGDDNADAATEGVAAPHQALIGSDFDCGALLIYRFEVNDAGPEPFTVDLTVIPADSTRG
ncbi:MAG TPA: hypothetical protein P5572_17130, partial [Phycisphaerae bacterium]|nr:hypothetical protein [Phycisphaerae bacterium]